MKKLLLLITALFILASVEGQILRYSNYVAQPEEPGGSENGLLTNLVAYWKLDESSGTLDDAVGSNNSTACIADYDSTGKINSCLYFNGGIGDYAEFADAANLQMYNQDFTMMAWVYMHDLPGTSTAFPIFGGEGGSAGFNIYTNSSGYTGFQVTKVNIGAGTKATVNYLNADTWYLVALIFDSSATTNNATFYYNGTTVAVTYNNDFTDGAGTIYMGKYNSTTGFATMLIDEAAIWKGRKLSTEDLDLIYNSGSGLAFVNYD